MSTKPMNVQIAQSKSTWDLDPNNVPPAKTGAELLEMLSKLTKEELMLPVSMEGCDCCGDLGGIDTSEKQILLLRTYSQYE